MNLRFASWYSTCSPYLVIIIRDIPCFSVILPKKEFIQVVSFPFSKLMCHWSKSLRSTFNKIFIVRVGWKVHRLTMRQWSNLTNCGLFFNIVSSAVHTLFPSVLQHLDSHGMKVLILILKKVLNCRYDLIIGLILLLSQVFFSCWGTKSIQMVPNQENMEGDQPVQTHSQTQQPLQPQICVQEHCPCETGLPSSVFQAIFKCLCYYFSKSWITYLVWIYLEGHNAVSIKKGWISMHAKILLSQPMNFSAHICWWLAVAMML